MVSRFLQPAEWMPHRACWLAWPSHADLWEDQLPAAQSEFVDLCRIIAQGERLEILVPDEYRLQEAKTRLVGLPACFHLIPFGDIWLRDTGPIFVRDAAGKIIATRYHFNGWGEKYILPGDNRVAERVTQAAGVEGVAFNWIFEGGAIEVDGEGTAITTRQCLLNPNRNRGACERDVEAWIEEALGIERLIWISEGLANDHTDGHIDTLARFIKPGLVVCMMPTDARDPNREVLLKIRSELTSVRNSCGCKLGVVEIPSPGLVEDDGGNVMPASYMNFYIANKTVVVPTYGVSNDQKAVESIASLFPERKVFGSSARAILCGGGAFHCITQQEPLPKESL